MAAAIVAESIRAVFFDAVGTLLLPAQPVSDTYRAIARRHGAEIEPEVIRIRLRESFEKQERLDCQAAWKTNENREAERWRAIVHGTLRETTNPDACFAELWEWYRSPTAWVLHAETGPVLRQLSGRGLILGLASNFDARLAKIVAAMPDLAPVAENCLISSLIGWRKPSAEFFREVIRHAGCDASRILFVGDDPRNDFEGARQSGMRAILVDPGSRETTRTLSAAIRFVEQSDSRIVPRDGQVI